MNFPHILSDEDFDQPNLVERKSTSSKAAHRRRRMDYTHNGRSIVFDHYIHLSFFFVLIIYDPVISVRTDYFYFFLHVSCLSY